MVEKNVKKKRVLKKEMEMSVLFLKKQKEKKKKNECSL